MEGLEEIAQQAPKIKKAVDIGRLYLKPACDWSGDEGCGGDCSPFNFSPGCGCEDYCKDNICSMDD